MLILVTHSHMNLNQKTIKAHPVPAGWSGGHQAAGASSDVLHEVLCLGLLCPSGAVQASPQSEL